MLHMYKYIHVIGLLLLAQICFLCIRVGPRILCKIYECHYNLFRVRVMGAELSVAVEKVTQLQGEKEKALADLNNIRKLNRTIERLVTHTYIYIHVVNYF